MNKPKESHYLFYAILSLLLKVRKLNLASFASIWQFASDFCRDESRLDVLINNAGLAGMVTIDNQRYTWFKLQLSTELFILAFL